MPKNIKKSVYLTRSTNSLFLSKDFDGSLIKIQLIFWKSFYLIQVLYIISFHCHYKYSNTVFHRAIRLKGLSFQMISVAFYFYILNRVIRQTIFWENWNKIYNTVKPFLNPPPWMKILLFSWGGIINSEVIFRKWSNFLGGELIME